MKQYTPEQVAEAYREHGGVVRASAALGCSVPTFLKYAHRFGVLLRSAGQSKTPLEVYGLFDPRSDELRYIGISVNSEDRFKAHVRDARVGDQSHKARWIAGLLTAGLSPSYRVFAVVQGSVEACRVESALIALYVRRGNRLTNMTSGGDFSPLCLPSEAQVEYRQKMSQVMTGKPKSREHAMKVGAAHRGRPKSAEQRAKISATKTGRSPVSADMRARISAKLRGRAKSPEHAAKIAAANQSEERRRIVSEAGKARVGEKRSEETRRRIGDSKRGVKLSAEHVAKVVAATTGLKRSEETRARMREAQRKRFQKVVA